MRRAAKDRVGCSGSNDGTVGQAAQGGKGHSVRAIDLDDGNVAIYCVVCGAYAIRRAIGLLGQCKGEATTAGKEALRRVREGGSPDPESDARIAGMANCPPGDGARAIAAAADARDTRRRPTNAPPATGLLPTIQRMAERLGIIPALEE